MSEKIMHVGDNDFDEKIINADGPVLVDYWAEWCGPCKMLQPILEDLATEYDGRLSIAKVDVDQNPRVSQQFNIRSMPTLMLFKDGNVQGMRVGLMSPMQLRAFVDEVV